MPKIPANYAVRKQKDGLKPATMYLAPVYSAKSALLQIHLLLRFMANIHHPKMTNPKENRNCLIIINSLAHATILDLTKIQVGHIFTKMAF